MCLGMLSNSRSVQPPSSKQGFGAPLVTIVTPTYNRAQHIGETLQSILAQDHPAIEVIVIDDGSTDGTSDVLAEFGSRISVIRIANSGQTAAVNKGFASAHGDYLMVVNDDDPLRSGAVAALVEALEANLDVLVAYPDWDLIDSDGTTVMHMSPLHYSFADMLRYDVCLPGPGAMFRRRVLDIVGGWDERFRWVADYDFWLRIGMIGPMMRVPERLATWRRHVDCATLASSRLDMALEQIDVMRNFFARSDLTPEIRALETEATGAALFVASSVAIERGSQAVRARFDVVDNISRLLATRVVPVGESTADLPAEVIAWQTHTIQKHEASIDRLRYELAIADNHIAALQRTIDLLQEQIGPGDGTA